VLHTWRETRLRLCANNSHWHFIEIQNTVILTRLQVAHLLQTKEDKMRSVSSGPRLPGTKINDLSTEWCYSPPVRNIIKDISLIYIGGEETFGDSGGARAGRAESGHAPAALYAV